MKRITVETDGPGTRTFTLNMTTNIPEWVEIEPRILRWKTTELGTPQQFRVKVVDSAKIKLDQAPLEMNAFYVKEEQEGPGVIVFSITPKSVTQRATEFLPLTAIATEDGVSRSRPFGVHCLIR
jgi:hypothetical protein